MSVRHSPIGPSCLVRASTNKPNPGLGLFSTPLEVALVCCGPTPSSPPPNHQAFEGLLLKAEDMAVANSMHPATARKPMDVHSIRNYFRCGWNEHLFSVLFTWLNP